MITRLEPVFFDKIWGGNRLHQRYHYPCSNQAGEAWGISAHPHGPSKIMDGPYKGMTFEQLFQSHKELFGHYPKDAFPILVKLIDAHADLSVQVHPDDAYAKTHEASLGKTECWYIIDTLPKTKIIIGHHAKTLDEFKQMVDMHQWDRLLNRFPVHKEDQFCVYSGTIHAICKGTLLLEIQQSSDVTYRLYDYDRTDASGHPRALHLEKAYDVIHFPGLPVQHDIPKNLFDFKISNQEGYTLDTADLYGDYLFILEGHGKINDLAVNQGDFVFISSKTEYYMDGDFKYFIANIK